MNDHAAAPRSTEGSNAGKLRAQLLADAAAAAALPGIDAAALHALRAKLAGRIFNLVVAGEFKRGKSSVVNALLGAEILPTGVVPLTSVVTILKHGDAESALVVFESGEERAIALDAVAEYVTERANPNNHKHVKKVEIAYPAPWLGRGIRLVDTPGIGSAHQHNSEVTYGYLPEADAVIFVASVDQPVSQSELGFLTDIRTHADRVFCLLNKIDHLTRAELSESVTFSTRALREALHAEVPVFPVSARVAIEARGADRTDGYVRSGFARFDTALQRFLERDSDQVLVHSVRQHLRRLLAACRLAAELEWKALAAPLESLEQNLRAFDAKKAETLQQRSDFAALLEADARRLVKDKIEPAIVNFKHELAPRLDARVPGWVEQATEQRDTLPQAALERYMVDAVRKAFDEFRNQEDSAAYAEFDRICARFEQRIEASVDELMRYSAELFQLRFEATATEPLREARSRFYYKFWENPDTMRLMAGTLAGLLPRAAQGPLLKRHGHRRIAELVETQSGRVRHDFEERILKATRVARKQMLARIDSTIYAIAAAIAKGRDLQASGTTAATARRQQLDALLEKLAKLESHHDVAA